MVAPGWITLRFRDGQRSNDELTVNSTIIDLGGLADITTRIDDWSPY